ncbi:uncharacterized protein LOC111674820 isoform X5 [Lucilia cuprina]|uniref:uncharacterized protein LOC111674820 isoform X5 n=1 Tax=Lucilia cuprina TaxID=7375 RepID=UPI001F051B31|nr:uncharacterized protein LOC111674820 isoform X5 [Lucilia cuprina]
MAAPFNLEDLAKLKSFVEFVAANPAILNLPQLDFLKKLIEQLGGKVPEGTFQMPAGAKCPFGGDVKSENKPTPASAEAEVDEEEIPEMEAESEESEVELDMEANHLTILEPNILYLEDKPPKIVKSSNKTRNTKTSKLKTLRKRPTKLKQDYIIKNELCIYEKQQEQMTTNDPNDPLYSAAKAELKSELEDERETQDIENDCGTDTVEYNDNDDDQDYNYEHDIIDNKLESSDEDNYDGNDNEDDDEPLIFLARRKGRPRKKMRDEENIKAPRSVVCKAVCRLNCNEKFTEQERINICDYYWNLNEEGRVAFIRKHIKARRLTSNQRITPNRSRANNCCCYLKPYQICSLESTPKDCTDFIRVCRRFFEATLCTTSKFIRKVNNGIVLEIEKELQHLAQIKLDKEKEKEKCQQPLQILDPETGNLTTFKPKANPESHNSSLDTKEKKTRKRRKPEVIKPEHIPKPIKCAERCIFKCHTNFIEKERKEICDIFWSMDYKRRKDFVLASIEVKDIVAQTTPDFRKSNRPPRTYQIHYFMRSGGKRGENFRVCKDFYIRTLCISSHFIENAIKFADKTTGYYIGTDRRGVQIPHNKKSDACKQTVVNQIASYPLWIPNKKTKTKYLHHSLTIKKMYDAYKDHRVAENKDYVSTCFYYKTFHDNFNLLFLANPHPKKGNALQKGNPNISHYTGEEPGGCWIDSKGNKLDIRRIDPAKSLNSNQSFLPLNISDSTSLSNPFNYDGGQNLVNPNSLMSFNSVRSDFNRNLTQDSINMLTQF